MTGLVWVAKMTRSLSNSAGNGAVTATHGAMKTRTVPSLGTVNNEEDIGDDDSQDDEEAHCFPT